MADMLSEWTNASVLALEEDDPVDAIVALARNLALDAVDRGWPGPPFDPFELARLLGISVVPRSDMRDARSFVSESGTTRIEFNPQKPASRIRFSIAHEIAHTLFPDFAERPRSRSAPERSRSDDWQLEVLCNLAAAELLMPATLFESTDNPPASMRYLLQERAKFEVSMEAVLLRLARLTKTDLAMFAAHRVANDQSRYQVDYCVPSSAWTGPRAISDVPHGSAVSSCTAVGFTAESTESWGSDLEVKVSCVGVPPYPGHRFPRVVGFLYRPSQEEEESFFTLIVGDALEPVSSDGDRVLLQVVNDKAARWGAGFARNAGVKWPAAAARFEEWAREPGNLHLGNTHLVEVEPDLSIVSMVAQRGYGPSSSPRIRYRALADCLREVAALATSRDASVHMPRIGAGLAGGNWWVIQELVEDLLCSRGIDVTVYELREQRASDPSGQLPLPLSTSVHESTPGQRLEATERSWRSVYS